MIKRGAPLF